MTWLPLAARIVTVADESVDTRTFVLALAHPSAALDAARPGQFVMLSILGVGEAAFTLSRLPSGGAAPGTITVTVRRMGALTQRLFALAPGRVVGVRGPYGRGFTVAPELPVLYVAGGCGLAPLAAAVDAHLATRADGTPITVLYGARTVETRILRTRLGRWASQPHVRVLECVAEPSARWSGRVGTVLDHLDEALAGSGARVAALGGPSAMLAAVSDALAHRGIPPTHIQVALERHMKCALGYCGHCYVNARYVCTDGPVFTLADLRTMPDAFTADERAATG